MLQAGRSRVRIPMRSLVFHYDLPNPSCHTVSRSLTLPLTEMNTRNLPGGGGGKARSALKADNLNTICEPIVYTSGLELGVHLSSGVRESSLH
jgi:hypothetical protein